MKKVLNTSRNRRNNAQGDYDRTLQAFMRLPHKIELMPLSKKDGGGYFATIPLLKGCQSDGNTPDETIKNLKEAQ